MRRSAEVVVIDSLQYTMMKFSDYKGFERRISRQSFSSSLATHEARNPRGHTADAVRYDSDVKIWIEGYRAFSMSRLGGGAYYDIWPEASAKYYNDDLEPGENI